MTDLIQIFQHAQASKKRRPPRTYPVAAEVIRISGEPTPEENMANQSRLDFHKKQLKYIVDELCALMPAARAKAFLELLISNAIEDNYK